MTDLGRARLLCLGGPDRNHIESISARREARLAKARLKKPKQRRGGWPNAAKPRVLPPRLGGTTSAVTSIEQVWREAILNLG